MDKHDPLCPVAIGVDYVISSFPIACQCDLIRKVTARDDDLAARLVRVIGELDAELYAVEYLHDGAVRIIGDLERQLQEKQ